MSRIHLTRGLELLSVTGFAVAQPLYDILGRYPDFLVAHGLGRSEILTLSLLLSFAIPTAAMALEIAIGAISQRLAAAVHVLFFAAGTTIIALQLTSKLEALPTLAMIGISLVIGGVGSVAMARIPAVASFVRLLAVAALLFPLLFLFSGRMAELTFADGSRGRSAPRIERPVPIVILVLDEFPAISLLDENRNIDPIRTPRLARFAASSTSFPRTSSGASYTTTALPMLLTGRHPEKHVLVATHSMFPDSLFSLLSPHYDVESFEPITQLCSPGICDSGTSGISKVLDLLPDLSILYLHLTLPPALADRMPSVSDNWKDFGSQPSGPQLDAAELQKNLVRNLVKRTEQSTGDFSSFLSRITPEQPRNTLYFFHSMLPHPTWKTLPSGQSYFVPGVFQYGLPRVWKDRWQSVQSYQRHLLQVGFTDRLIGMLLDRLVEVGIYDEALIVIISDHGASFRHRDARRDITPTNSAELMLVPFLLKLPGQTTPVVIDRPIETVDLLPTVADVIGAEIPWTVDGHSALDPDAPRRSEYITTKSNGSRTLYSVSEVDRVMEERLEYKLSLFDRRPGTEGLHAIGPYPQLLDRKVTDFPIALGPTLLASWIEDVERLHDVDPQAPILPTLINGGILGPTAEGRPIDIAIALNGTIRAVTTTFNDSPGRALFMAMLPQSCLVAGVNRPRLFRVLDQDGAIELQRIR